MSDGVDQNEIVELANEYRRLQRQIEAKTQQLDALLSDNAPAGDFPVDFAGARNRRYSIELPFVPGVLDPQERSVTVRAGTIFRCAAMETWVRAVGTANDPYTGSPTTVQATLPWNNRLTYFDFFARIRDTGTDREWMDQPQPSLFLGGGYVGPLWFPRRTILGGGTTIFVNVDPIVSAASPTVGSSFFQGGSIQQYILQVDFIGHEVPDGGAL